MPVLGVWMWPQSSRIYGADRVCTLCTAIGVTDIFLLTKGLSGEVSYHSAIAPRCSDRDLLAELLCAAHARNIRVHAWLTSASDEHYKNQHPESGRCHYTRGRDKGLISLADEGYLAYMQRIVRELCQGYAIDGLHLDYIRYNHLLYGWSQEDEARYANAGADVAHLHQLMDRTFLSGQEADRDCIFDALRAGDPSVLALANARRNDVVRFAQTLTASAREVNPSIYLSAALMPEGAYADTAFADLHYGQRYDDASFLYDAILPMAYAKAYEKDSEWVHAVAEGALQASCPTIMGLHAYDGGTAASLHADIHVLADMPIAGICLFRFGAFAIAIRDGGSLQIINTLERTITGIEADNGTQLLPAGTTLEPGCEVRLSCAQPAHTLRIFCGQEEACLYCPDHSAMN